MKNSEGSKPDSGQSIRKDYNPNSLAEHSPAETDHPIAPPKHALCTPAANEVVRRKANRERDNSRRWGVVNSPMGVQDRSVPGE
jgi:hypothetical protein